MMGWLCQVLGFIVEVGGSVAVATFVLVRCYHLLGGSTPFTVYLAVIFYLSYRRGIVGGLLGLTLSGFAVAWFFIEPIYQLIPASLADQLALGLFFLIGGLIVSLMEVTKQAAAQVAESEQRFRKLANSAPVLLWMTNQDGQGTIFNRGWNEFIGWPETNELCREEWLYYVHPDDQERCRVIYHESVDLRQEFQIEYRLRRIDGRYRWILDTGIPRFSDGDKHEFEGYVGSCIDITDRRLAEEQTKLGDKLFRLLPVAVYLCSPNGTIKRYNETAANLWGKTPVEGQESNSDTFRLRHLDGSLMEFSETPMAEVFETGLLVRDREVLLEQHDGRAITVLISVEPLRVEQEVTGAIIVVQNIHEQKQLSNELKQRTEELLTIDRRKDDFLAMLAHELRNPLAPIENALAILDKDVDESIVHWAKGTMGRQIQHLARLVDDLLDVSRIMRGKIELKKETVELCTIISRAIETAKPVIEAHGHRLRVDLPKFAVYLFVDQIRLSQVIANLLNNAAKYTERGGNIQIRATVSSRQELQIQVEDNGIGVDPSILPVIFEPFFQADRSLDRSKGGLGMGLAIVKSLVELHEGKVEACSSGTGKGTVFTITFPSLGTEKGLTISPVPTPDIILTPRDILVVDDNVDAVHTLSKLLKMDNHQVRVVYDGVETLKAIEESIPQIVILDIGLPGMSGYEIAKEIRKRWGEKIVLIAMTGYGREEDKQASREAGFNEHLVKPVKYSNLEVVFSKY